MRNLKSERNKLINGSPKIEIVKSCTINDGIIKIDNEKKFINLSNNSFLTETCFIPSSGSGSRMFQFLYDFINSSEYTEFGKIERFFNRIDDFAFFQYLPSQLQQNIKEHKFNIYEVIDFIVKSNGLNLGSKPKALIPFHKLGPLILNPLQEHILQAITSRHQKKSFHFTINKLFEYDFKRSISSIQELIGHNINYELSEQNPKSNSYVFDTELNPIINKNGDYLKRPSGHGSLLENLNNINSDIIYIKNIDNVQHYNNSKLSQDAFKIIKGCIIYVSSALKKISQYQDTIFLKQFEEINSVFQIFQEDLTSILSINEVKKLINRPLRVCGMVRNEGEPGGGPFWVKESSGIISKQIIEKNQMDLNLNSNQLRILTKSTHFNPVFMGLYTKNIEGDKFDFDDYKSTKEYFVVEKSQLGKRVKFIEKPGLWNGGMYNWNTIFLEINSNLFTPVKTILDLLNPLHY